MHTTRRTAVRASAWTAPVVLITVPVPAFACSPHDRNFYSGDLALRSVTQKSSDNGHTVGTFTFLLTNNGTLPIPAGTTYTLRLYAHKAPGDPSGDKDIAIAPTTLTGFSVDPMSGAILNPDGPVVEKTYTVTTTSDLPVGSTASVVFSVDTATGIGATALELTADFVRFGGNDCATPETGNQATLSGMWGKDAD